MLEPTIYKTICCDSEVDLRGDGHYYCTDCEECVDVEIEIFLNLQKDKGSV